MADPLAGRTEGRVKVPGSLRQRFLLLTFAIALPALVGAAVLIADAYRFNRAQTERQLLETTRAMSLVVDRQLGQSEAVLRALIASPNLARGDLRHFEAQARGAVDPAGSWIVLYDMTGRQLLNTRLPAGSALPPPVTGTLRAAAKDIGRGRTHYCNLTEGPVAGHPVLCVARPVMVGGKIAYALVVAFEPRTLDPILTEQRLPHSWYAVILDRNSRILARAPRSDGLRGRVASASFRERMKRSPHSVIETVAHDGVPVLSAVDRAHRSGWMFVVAMPRAELAIGVQRSLALGVGAALLLLALGVGLSILAARGLTRPIQNLAADAGRLGQGGSIAPRQTGVIELDTVSAALAKAATDLSTVQLRLNLAKQAGRIGVWEWNGDTGESWWSNSFYQVVGLDPATIPDQQHFFRMIVEDDRARAIADIDVAAPGDDFDTTFRFVRSDGETRWLTARGRCLSTAPRQIIGICFDVTETRQLADKLEAANALLESRVAERTAERDRTWKLGRDLFALAALDGRLLAVNPAWTELLGRPEDELIGRPITDFVHPDDIQPTAAQFADLAAGHVAERFEHRLRHRDGRWRLIAWTAVPEEGQVHAVGRDITDERAAAEELAGAQAALHEAQKLETLGQLTGGVAHDFNNLLTPIVGTLDLLRRRLADDKRAIHLLDAAVASADRARTLVDRLLTFARRQTLKPRAVDIGDLVGGMVDLIRRSLGPTVPVAVDIPADLPPALIDPNQLELALLNLAVNARDAMPNGGTLSIAARADEPLPAELRAGRYVRLSVSDEGEGMDAETLRRAVEPFFSTKGVGKGTGLGLSMAHGLAAQSGGALLIDSVPKRGTVVSFWLPAGDGDADAQRVAPTLAVARHQGTILLVDDEAAVRAMTAAMLDDLGCTVIEAGSGAVALALLRDGVDVDALITDHLMPGMVGSTLIEEARTLRPGMPAMIVSGYGDAATDLPDDVQRLAKPFLSPELSARLDKLLPSRAPAA